MSTAPLVRPIQPEEVEWCAVRAQGPGGQNVNKVSSAVHLRFDVRASALPEAVKERLLALHDSRITQDGVVVIKAQQFRSQEQNLADAMARLNALVQSVAAPPRVRRAPARAALWSRPAGSCPPGGAAAHRTWAWWRGARAAAQPPIAPAR